MESRKICLHKWLSGVGAVATLSCGSGSTCVARGTRVTTPSGKRRVEALRVGDEVIAINPYTGEARATIVTHIRSSRRECGALSTHGSTLTATADHPLFDPNERGFHPAGDWMLGSRSQLLTFDGTKAQVTQVSRYEVFVGLHEVFDLSVDCEWHTFIAEDIVVHNKQPADCLIPDGGMTNLGITAQQRPVCTCANGDTGRWTCEHSGGTATCALCGQDAGP